MFRTKAKILAIAGALAMASIAAAEAPTAEPSPAKVALGKLIFHDTRLSEPPGQSCVSCHSPERAFADPGRVAISAGAAGRFGNRNSPSITYAKFAPKFGFVEYSQKWAGGQFWDGRADTLAEQALMPFLNPLEMNNTPQQLVAKIRTASYKDAFGHVYGDAVWKDETAVLAAATDALAAFQSSDEIGRFTSKFDYFKAEKVELTPQEQRGLFVFSDNGKCMNCHATSSSTGPVMLTDFTYHNIGVPKNPNSPFLHVEKEMNPKGLAYIDEGLALNIKVPESERQKLRGKFRTPSLRNVALTAPYMHNGVLKTLREVVEFYNTRDVSDRWGEPEVLENMDIRDTGDLKLSEADIDALVAFMLTLTDGYELPKPQIPPTSKDALRPDAE